MNTKEFEALEVDDVIKQVNQVGSIYIKSITINKLGKINTN